MTLRIRLGRVLSFAAVRRSLVGTVLPIAAFVALAATGTEASAAMPPGACDVTAAIARALPSVVNITVVKVSNGEDATATPSTAEKSAAVKSAAAPAPDDQIAVFVGSGSIIDPSGIIITNKHVIQGAAMIRVIFHDKTEVPAQLIAAANLVDLALLKVNMPQPLPALQFGDSDTLQVGQPVIAIGNPLGIGTSVSTGIVSGLNRDLMRTPLDDFIQTDATLNPGNSGGPLLNCQGDMIGVNTALLSNNSLLGSIGLGFALPSNDAKFVAGRLRSLDAVPDWVGLHLQDLRAQLATSFGRPNMQGAIVTGVDPGSPAALASLRPGDIITAADGQDMPDSRAVLRAVIEEPPKAEMTLSVWRQGQMMVVPVQTRPWPDMMALRSDVLASAASVQRAQANGLGLHLAAITPEDVKQYQLTRTSGVLVDEVTPGSEAATMGLRPGDVIEQVGTRPATTVELVTGQLHMGDAARGDLVSLLVHSGSATRWVTLYVGHIDVAELITPVEQPNMSQTAADASARQR